MVLRAIPLWSEALGLSVVPDAVEIQSGVVRPVEYKSGTRHGLAADLQLCAQALCLEEMLDVGDTGRPYLVRRAAPPHPRRIHCGFADRGPPRCRPDQAPDTVRCSAGGAE